jgi:hypothetical protein
MAITKGYTTLDQVLKEYGNLPLSGAYAFLFQTYNLPKTVSAADEARVFGSYMDDKTSLRVSDVLVKPSPMVVGVPEKDAGQPWAVPAGQTRAEAIAHAWLNSSSTQVAEGSQEILHPGSTGGSVAGSTVASFAMESTPYATEIQQGYLAFFLRPADAQGYNYFAKAMTGNGGSLDAIVAQFGNSTEYLQTYAGMSSSQRINAIYQNLFSRDAESAGLDYWKANLDAGKLTIGNIALTILRSANNDDAKVVANRIEVAKSFTSGMTNWTKIDAYAGLKSAADARDLLKKVSADALTIPAAKAALTGTLKTIGIEGSVTHAASGDVIQLSNASKIDVVSINASSVGKVDEIRGFSHDIIDLSSFGMVNAAIAVKTASAQQTADSGGFFSGKGAAMAQVGSDTYIYVDANHDGSFNAATDVTIKVVGAAVQASEIWF